MDKETWIEECTKLYVSKTGMSSEQAIEYAKTLVEDSYPESTPEEAVDSELSYWDE